ncbi:MAG: efflux RND transporter permease subunit, partial [Candidatus Dormibacteraceae bacterium]
MSTVVRWCLTNRTVVILFSLILLVAGGISTFQINQELLPSIEVPSVFVLVSEPGAGPEQIDQDVTQPLIKGLTGLPQEQHTNSTSSQGFSQVSIDFNLNSTLKDDQDAVNRALPQIVLPSTAAKPQVQTFSFSSFPSMTYALEAKDGDLARITQEANNVIMPALNGASGGAQIKVSGGAQSEVTITLDPSRLAANKVSIQEVQQALSASHVDMPAGESTSGDKSLPVQVLGTLKNIDDL